MKKVVGAIITTIIVLFVTIFVAKSLVKVPA